MTKNKEDLDPTFPHFAKEDADKVLNEFFDICKELGIIAFLWHGTVLGLYRDKDYCRTDRDVDVGVYATNKQIEQLFTTLRARGFSKSPKVRGKYKIWLDISFRFCKDEWDFLQNLDQIVYKGRTYNVPGPNIEDYLVHYIGKDWRKPKDKPANLKILLDYGFITKEEAEKVHKMNVLICCGGKLGSWGASFEQTEGTTQKGNLSLGKETIVQRQVRLLRKKGFNDFTIAYTGEKPKVENVKFRKVIFKPLLQFTVYQCRDLIQNTIIISGDVVWEKGFLDDILVQDFSDCLYVLENIFLVKPSGAKKIHQMYKDLKYKFEKGGWSKGKDGTQGGAGHKFADLELPLKKYNCNIKKYFSKYRMTDIDIPSELVWWRKYLKEKEYSK